MVLLGRFLLARRPKGADYGLYGGRTIKYGVVVTPSNKKTKRRWFPNIVRKTFDSKLLGVKLQIRVAPNVIRRIDMAGGFDNYIYNMPAHKLDSKLGVYLKEEMQKVVQEKGLTPPTLGTRFRRLPKFLRHQQLFNTTETTPSEQLDSTQQ